jgi:hypothetical protein
MEVIRGNGSGEGFRLQCKPGEGFRLFGVFIFHVFGVITPHLVKSVKMGGVLCFFGGGKQDM